MNYEMARSFLAQRKQYGSRPGLTCIKALLKRLGSPQEQLCGRTLSVNGQAVSVPSVIQIAGTNGKGSVGAFLGQILTEAGYSVGRFSSPAVFDVRETITAGGEQISRQAYADGIARIAAHVEELDRQGLHPTEFEIETALALLYFAEAGCEVVLLEAGMGGALDATNVFGQNMLAVVTSISYDHMAFLGGTLTEIALQKAGIARAGGILLTQPQAQEVMETLEKDCRERNIRLLWAQTRLLDELVEKTGEKLELGLQGAFQRENAALAAASAKTIACAGIEIENETILRGLSHTSWPGRFQKLSAHPDVWIDGAHNPDAAKRVVDSVRMRYGEKKIVWIAGMFRDKDCAAVIRCFSGCVQQLYTISLAPPRGLSAAELMAIAQESCPELPAAACASVTEALERAAVLAGEDGVILAAGSLSYLREVVRCCRKRQINLPFPILDEYEGLD